MQFKDIVYQRPDMKALKSSFNQLLKEFKGADSSDSQQEIIGEINHLRNNFDTMWNVASIRHSIDTGDAVYEEENNFFDSQRPEFQDLVNNYYLELVNSKYKDELQKNWGRQLFNIAEQTSKTFDPVIIEDLKEENRLISEYNQLLASASIEFRGKKRNLSDLKVFMESPDRTLRKEANESYWGFFQSNEKEFDTIFDKLVKLRDRVARKLGYKNFVELGYNRMLRDYSAKDVAHFRSLIHKNVVPKAIELRQRQAQRIGLNELKYYDIPFDFKTGNPEPKGNPKWIVENGRKMYHQLSSPTGHFFDYMLERGLMDLVNKKGKAPGGYCTYLADYQAPFIFSNFNGTSHDIDVLTHEAGHAFQVFQSRHHTVPEYLWPTYEACEIHSMAMELFTWPFMNFFFEEDTEKYKFSHLSSSLLFLPYGAGVDEFQHFIYENPEASPKERKAAYRAIEKKYTPWIDYEDNSFLEEGAYWQRQAHIYELPFYYIDYTLAQICAFQFWVRSQQDRENAFKDYLKLCEAGGSRSFQELVEYADLKSPFSEEAFKTVVGKVMAYLNSIDDQSL